jgi:hypothetical protein
LVRAVVVVVVVVSAAAAASGVSVTCVDASIGVEAILTNYMQQSSSWEANRSSASQEIPRILCAPNVHHRSTCDISCGKGR